MRRITAIVLLLLTFVCRLPAQEKHPPSTPQERARLVDVAAKLRAEPLSPNYRADREWAIMWMIEIPDITVEVCSAGMPWESKQKYAGELMAVSMTSMAAYVIQHPEKPDQKPAVGLAGVEAVLDAYEAIVRIDPKANSKKLNELLALRNKGELADEVQRRWKKECK